ncbi:MAG: hypothetical protein GY953_29925, partial [bacterium]|nr:hypothetical protein [bacterium]
SDPHAANSFEALDEVKLAELPVTTTGNELRARIPKNAVAAIEIRLT